MNIVVERADGGRIYCRPDTTWERENKDYYSPDGIQELWWSPIVFVRICKAGKSIGKKFATRYYDAVGYGALLYIGDSMPDVASASCADHTSLLPFPMYNPAVLENKGNAFMVMKDGECIFAHEGVESEDVERIENAICNASRLTSLRIGDFVAVELQPTGLLSAKSEGKTAFKASYCENSLFDFKIIH